MQVRGVKSWIERGQMHLVEDDVLGVIQQIKALDDRLSVYYNDWKGGFDIVESVKERDGSTTDKLVFHVEELDQRVVGRLLRADHWQGQNTPTNVLPDDQDFLSAVEEDERRIDEEKAETQREVTRELVARWGNAMELDGRGLKSQILVVKHYNTGSA